MSILETTLTSSGENTAMKWILCPPQIEDFVLITPEGLNDIPIDSHYQEISSKQVQKEYFNHKHYLCKIHGHK